MNAKTKIQRKKAHINFFKKNKKNKNEIIYFFSFLKFENNF